MEDMCKRALPGFLSNPSHGGLITSFVQAHLKFEGQMEEDRWEVMEAWEAVQWKTKKMMEEAGDDPSKFLNSPSGKAFAMATSFSRERLGLA